jgi:lipopolysaccharide/colanic/teichoic acid biosynthesis glycosyltransferase/CheY-like chemotaxis protein
MNGANILVVDDDPEMCQLLSTMLGKQDFQVETAYDGFEGMEKVRTKEPDLVVLDIMMPEMDGWETCRRMKAVSDVPVLFLTVRSDVSSVARGFDVGGDDYVCKPFRSQDLTTRIENLLNNNNNTIPILDTLPSTSTETKSIPYVMPGYRPQRFYFILKRLLDILIAGAMLILLSPLMLLLALLIKLDSPGSVIFKQERVGSNPKEDDQRHPKDFEFFIFYKFRTMRRDATPDTHRVYLEAFIQNDHKRMDEVQGNGAQTRKLTADPRVTRLGKFLRKSSMDELPQLWNVIRGDMSIVGPRPPIPYEVEMYKPWHRKRMMAKPGLTGLWQVTARSSADFDEMVRMDIWYIEHQSLWLDLRILLKTPLSVLSMEGAV